MRISFRARLALLSLVTVTLSMSCEDRVIPEPTSIMPFEFQDVPAYIPADGVSQLEVTATVVSTDGTRLVNIPVLFSTTEGTLTQSTALTDSSGIATTNLISIESLVDVTGYVDANVDSPYTVTPKTTSDPVVQTAPPGSVAMVSTGPLPDEELEARLHAILLKRAYENAQVRRKGMGALLGEPEGGYAGGLQESEADRLTVIFEGIEIALSSDKTQLPADGISTTSVSARVRTVTRGINISGAEISFAAQEGQITSTANTDEFGVIQVTFKAAITSATTDTITALLGNTLSETLVLDYTQPVLTIAADESYLPSDRNSSTAIRARLLTQAGIPIEGATVEFSLLGPSDVSIVVQGATNSSGEAIATVKAGETEGTATITATFSDLSASTTVDILGIDLTLTSAKPSILADGRSTTQITFIAKTRTTNVAVANRPITFASNLGTIPATATTNLSGIAQVDLTSGTTTGTATIEATIAGLSITTTVDFIAVDLNIGMTSTPSTVLRDGVSTSTVNTYVTDNLGIGVGEQIVSWSLIGSTPSGVSLSASSTTTGDDGQTNITLFSDAGLVDATASVRAAVGSFADTFDVTLHGLVLLLTPTKSSLPANGTSSTSVTLVAKTEGPNVAVVGETVTFSTDLGTIPATSQTNSAGIAVANLTSSTTSGTATVTAQIGEISMTTQVTFAAIANITVELSSPKTKLLRDGNDQTTLTAQVVDGDGTALDERVVTFNLSGVGSLSSTQPQQTNQGGIATVSLLADASSADGTATIIASSEGQSDTLDITMRGISMVLTASPASIVANGNNTTTLSLLLRETTTNAGIPNRTIQFATTLGTIPATSLTNSSGVAQADLTSSSSSGTATITASLGSVSTTATVSMIAEALNLTLSSNQGSILRDGIATTDLTIIVQDPYGAFLDNRNVTWSISGGGSVFPAQGQTGQGGSAPGTHITTLTTDAGATDATSTVTVTVGDSTDSVDITLKGISLTAAVATDQNTIIGDDSDSAAITATLIETTGRNPVVGKTISFSTNLGTVTASATTDDDGKATATLKGTSSGIATVTAKLNDTLSATATVVIIDQALTVSVAATDTTLLRDGVSTTTITVTVTDNDGTVLSGRDVDWGLSDASSGSLSDTTQTTDANGHAIATFKSDAANSTDALNNTIRATVGGSSGTATVDLRGITLSISSSTSAIIADDTDAATITLQAVETSNGNPVVGTTISFSSDLGTVTASDETDSEGKATATLKSSSAGTATVTATLGNSLTANTSVTVNALALTVSTSASTSSILRDGVSTSTVTVTVTDNNSATVSGQTVTWSVSAGTGLVSPTTATTDANGQATTTFTTDANAADGSGTVQASVGGNTDTAVITLRGVTLTLTTSPDTLSAGGTSTATISASLTETVNNVGISGKTISFTATSGVIEGSEETIADGSAIVTLTPASSAGTDTITGTYGGLTDSTFVVYISGGVANISPVASDTATVAYASSDSLIAWNLNVIVSDSLFNPLEGVEVRWSASPDTLGSIVSNTTSDANGVATTTVVYHRRFGGRSITVTVRSGSAVRTETLVLPIP